MEIETPKITEDRIKQFLMQDKRFDNRKPSDFREISIETGISKKAEGSARVRMGKTDVIVGVKLDISEPYPDSPDQGNLMTTAELLPMSSPRISLGRPGIDSIEIGRIIDRCVRESKFIDMKKLCIREGEKVWSVFIDIYSLNDDGNLLDAAAIGTIIALKTAEIPKYDEKEEKILYGESSGKKLPLKKEIPLSITVYNIGDKFIVDPTREEEDITKTRITIGAYNGSICSIQKGEEKALSFEQIEGALDMHEKVWSEVFKKIEKHLK
jgi:exosome complex component RRP42